MPQMKPMMWLFLFILFSIILVIYSIMNYYVFVPIKSYNSHFKNLKNKNLKWSW